MAIGAKLEQAILPCLDEGISVRALTSAIAGVHECQEQARRRVFRLLQHAVGVYRSTGAAQLLDAALDALDAQQQQQLVLPPGSHEAQLAQYGAYLRSLRCQLRQLDEAVEANHALELVQGQLTEFRQQLAARQYTEAAWTLLQLRKAAQDGERQRSGEAPAAGDGRAADEAEGASAAQLAAACETCESELLQTVSALLDQALHVEPDAQRIELRSMLRDGTNVADLWQCLEVSALLPGFLATLVPLVIEGVAAPILASGSGIVVTTPAPDDSGVVVSWSSPPSGSGSSSSNGGGSSSAVDQSVKQLLQLIGQRLFQYNSSLMKAFGDLGWQQLADAYVRLHVQPRLMAQQQQGASAADYDDNDGGGADACDALIGAAQDLKDYAESLGYVEDGSYLVACVEGLVRQALQARQQRYIVEARAALLSTVEQPTALVGQPLAADWELHAREARGQLQEWELADPPCGVDLAASSLDSSTGQYQVTRRAVQLVELVDAALQQACASRSRTEAQALCQTACSIGLLARTITPRIGGGGGGGAGAGAGAGAAAPADAATAAADSAAAAAAASSLPPSQSVLDVPQLALLQHNDLMHLAKQMLLLPHAHAPELAAALGGTNDSAEATTKLFMEEALQLREAALQVRRRFLFEQRRMVEELLEGLEGLRRLGGGNASKGIAYRRTIRQVLHSIGRLGRLSLGLLAPAHFVELCAGVVNTACDVLLAAVLDKRDIGVDECRELVDICGPLCDEAAPALLGAGSAAALREQQAAAAGGASSGLSLGQLAAALDDASPKARKLRRLLHLLDAKLSDILEAWQGGDLQRDGFSQGEVEHLVRALFEDTPYRQDVLRKILFSSVSGMHTSVKQLMQRLT